RGGALACPSLQLARERQCLLGVDSSLVHPPGGEVGHPRAQRDEPLRAGNLASAELLYDASNQRERFVSTAGEGIHGAEGRGGDRYRGDDLPRSAQVEGSLEDPGRAREISATEVGVAMSEQPPVQRDGMGGRFGDAHGGLSVPDGLVEPANLREHVGERGPRDRRLDGGDPEALVAQVTLERDVTLEEGGRIAELAPGDVRPAQKGCCNHRPNPWRSLDRGGQGLLPNLTASS